MSYFDLGAEFSENSEALAGDVLPEDAYVCTVKSAKSGTTQKGKPKFGLQLEVAEGPYAGRTLPDQLTWSPESEVAMRIFSESLAVLGAPKDWIITVRPSPEQIVERITGSKVEIFVKEGEFNGRPRNNVSYRKNLGSAVDAQSVSLAAVTDPAAATVVEAAASTTSPWG